MIRKPLAVAAALVLATSVATLSAVTGTSASADTGVRAVADARPQGQERPRPVIFVHGGAGSGAQFQTQARRLASNGYPAEYIETHDYDSTFGTNTLDQVFAGLDQRVTRLLKATGADKVDMLGHSLGTGVMQNYLRSSPERAARVAHYVNLDGATATALPGGVPTMAVWGEGNAERTIVGATNVAFPTQSHTQVVTSPETFTQIYKFFTGKAPKTTRIIPQPPGKVKLSGRAVLFPSNVGVTDATLEVYPVHAITGTRMTKRPVARYALSGDGSFGPFAGRGDVRYEFAIVRSNAPTHHLYYQPFHRTDRLIRLLTSKPGEGLSALTENSATSTNLVINRYKEWWGDQGAGSDSLTVDGREVLNAANAPRSKRVIGIFAFDKGLDKATDLTAPIPAFFSQTFMTGIDVYVSAEARGSVRVVATPRGGNGKKVAFAVPRWPSNEHRVSIQYDDYL